ncbi:MAG: hypothetical protein NTU54_08500, partial [Candidatus Omnitrophica bacterium]|nr:hypothetical protein [Candidatus Omnitrophota bacterium]
AYVWVWDEDVKAGRWFELKRGADEFLDGRQITGSAAIQLLNEKDIGAVAQRNGILYYQGERVRAKKDKFTVIRYGDVAGGQFAEAGFFNRLIYHMKENSLASQLANRPSEFIFTLIVLSMAGLAAIALTLFIVAGVIYAFECLTKKVSIPRTSLPKPVANSPVLPSPAPTPVLPSPAPTPELEREVRKTLKGLNLRERLIEFILLKKSLEDLNGEQTIALAKKHYGVWLKVQRKGEFINRLKKRRKGGDIRGYIFDAHEFDDFFAFLKQDYEADKAAGDPFARVMGGDIEAVAAMVEGGVDIVREKIVPYLRSKRDPGLNKLMDIFLFPRSYIWFLCFMAKESIKFLLNKLTFGLLAKSSWFARVAEETSTVKDDPENASAKRFWNRIIYSWLLGNIGMAAVLLYYWRPGLYLAGIPGLIYVFCNFILVFFAWGYTYLAFRSYRLGRQKQVAVARSWSDAREYFRILVSGSESEIPTTSGIKNDVPKNSSSTRFKEHFATLVEDMLQECTISQREKEQLLKALKTGELPRHISTNTALERIKNLINDAYMRGVPEDPRGWNKVQPLSVVINGGGELSRVTWRALDTLEDGDAIKAKFLGGRVTGIPKETVSKFYHLKFMYAKEWQYFLEKLARDNRVSEADFNRVIGRLLGQRTSLEDTKTILGGLGILEDIAKNTILDWANWRLENACKTFESAAKLFDVYKEWYRKLNPAASDDEARIAANQKVQILILYGKKSTTLAPFWASRGWGDRPTAADGPVNIRLVVLKTKKMNKGPFYKPAKYGRWAAVEPELEQYKRSALSADGI